MMQFSNFSLNFLNQIKVFFIKIEVVNKDGLLHWCNWHNPNANFDKKILAHASKNLTKGSNCINLKKWDQIETRKN